MWAIFVFAMVKCCDFALPLKYNYDPYFIRRYRADGGLVNMMDGRNTRARACEYSHEHWTRENEVKCFLQQLKETDLQAQSIREKNVKWVSRVVMARYISSTGGERIRPVSRQVHMNLTKSSCKWYSVKRFFIEIKRTTDWWVILWNAMWNS